MQPSDWSWTRRTLLKTSVAGVLLLSGRLLDISPARAQRKGLPEGELAFYNVHTDERLRVRYRDESGGTISPRWTISIISSVVITRAKWLRWIPG